MACWIFKCNPEKYDLESRLADPNLAITWTVSRYRDEINAGDIVFLWVTGANRGIRAAFRVENPPRLMQELESEQAYWKGRDTQEQWRVTGNLTHRNLDLSHTDLRAVPGLEELSVFTGFQQTTNFAVTPEQGLILTRLVG